MLAPDTILGGRYRLGPVIGRGGGADVFRAHDLTTQQPVAVKVLRGPAPIDLRRFEQEVETLSRLDHPAIVRMLDDGDHEGVPYLVLDLVDGVSLSEQLANGPSSEEEVARIGAVLAGALAHAHSLGVVHRDVKPSNVLFDRDGGVHLTDFGIARLSDMAAITATGFVMGTAAYLAPEQLTGDGAVPASDVYALGLVLLEALTGVRSFAGSPSEAAVARLQRSPEIPTTVAPSLATLLGAMTASDPILRPTAATVAGELEAGVAPSDATAVLPIASDDTVAIALAPTLAPALAPTLAPSPAPPSSPVTPGHVRAGLVATGIVLALLVLGSVFGGGDGTVTPATAETSTTVGTTTAPVVAPTSTTAPAKKGKGKQGNGGDNDGGD